MARRTGQLLAGDLGYDPVRRMHSAVGLAPDTVHPVADQGQGEGEEGGCFNQGNPFFDIEINQRLFQVRFVGSGSG